MKAKLLAALVVSTTMFPVIAFAQNERIPNMQVNAQTVQAEQNGTLQPSNVHSADGVVKTSAPSNSGYGNASAGTSQSGSVSQTAGLTALYGHH